ncbi:hypothetical protein CBI31_09945 [Polynucleobacter campilacus]|uniref:C-type lysozyme inhibitor domain-containing protein n=2 Tax=Polynucleobacter campilacus TaxID=1743163 RepID=A0A254PW39_9BURK|nr:hypothetical protein CBI31_09945 [Polynucleobacter campilacus]
MSTLLKSASMRTQGALVSLLLTLALWGCDAQAPKVEAIDSQSKTLSCSLNGSPIQIFITKGSLDASVLYEGKEIKVNLLEVKDFYQILMRFDPQIGQLKMNKMGNELTQVKAGNEQVATCVAELKKS